MAKLCSPHTGSLAGIGATELARSGTLADRERLDEVRDARERLVVETIEPPLDLSDNDDELRSDARP